MLSKAVSCQNQEYIIFFILRLYGEAGNIFAHMHQAFMHIYVSNKKVILLVCSKYGQHCQKQTLFTDFSRYFLDPKLSNWQMLSCDHYIAPWKGFLGFFLRSLQHKTSPQFWRSIYFLASELVKYWWWQEKNEKC